jgi:hypothetical protein
MASIETGREEGFIVRATPWSLKLRVEQDVGA